jgi:hypothetical protein
MQQPETEIVETEKGFDSFGVIAIHFSIQSSALSYKRHAND